MDDHDAIIIGTGQSGPSLARRLVAAMARVINWAMSQH
jgi:predicted dinucleotide-binding enzyme